MGLGTVAPEPYLGYTMKLNNFIEGLQIFQPYYDNPDGYHIGAEHDQVYVYSTDKPLPEAAVERLVELGWFQPDSEVEEGFGFKDYRAEEGWSAYV